MHEKIKKPGQQIAIDFDAEKKKLQLKLDFEKSLPTGEVTRKVKRDRWSKDIK